MRKLLRLLVAGLAALLLAAGAAALWARSQLRASLPQVDGTRRLQGLSAPVSVTRDGLGIPTIRGANRMDVARATGFLHAQDRFFQMDLARRRAAGELAALVGARALVVDRATRIHRFRAQARRSLSLLSPSDREILDAYAAGVNAGLAALEAPPFEYLLLRLDPDPWKPEDSLLVVLSMFITLQDTDGEYESTLATMHELLPKPMFDFLAPAGSEWDAPIVGGAFAVPPIPGPEVYDLRSRRAGKPQLPTPKSQRPNLERVGLGVGGWELGVDAPDAIGSNNFAVAGRLTASGGALVANDMHLTIRVPNTWYRAVLDWPLARRSFSEGGSNPAGPHRVAGVTLPGVPAVVAGSNMHVAWGFTNTYADWSDIVLIDVDPARPGQYLTLQGWREFERHEERIAVAGQTDERRTVLWTIWGPVLEPDYRGRPRAYRWVAHSAEQLATGVTPLESARSLEDAFNEANGLGAPGQNFVAADRTGRIGWTVYGSIPRRVGLDGQIPQRWSDGSRGWNGWLSDEQYPRIVDPPDGRIWTANARVVNGEMLALLGDGSYEIGSRARVIRDRLASRDRFTARDLLDIQLDTQTKFLSRWRGVILRTLTPALIGDSSRRMAFREVVERNWSNGATPDSASYRLTRQFRDVVSERVMTFVLAACYEADPGFDYTTVRRRDAAIWTLVTEQPQHLLDPQYSTWSELLVAAIDETIAQAMSGRSGDLRDRAWSEYNIVEYRHPLSGGIPLLGRWLDMPKAAMPGDLYTPRVHWGAIGASERMVVSPGREAEGIMHMPTGQSGHPLSPYYANSHGPWVKGEPTPFLPGPTQHTLTLMP
jgi:penicillin amidase